MSYSRLVYSTDGGSVPSCPTCGKRPSKCVCDRPARGPAQRGRAAAPARGPTVPNDGVVRIFRDRGGRKGKTVTVVTGVPAAKLSEVATLLKRVAAAGGGVSGETIEIQGDHRDQLAARLSELGYRVKLAGG